MHPLDVRRLTATLLGVGIVVAGSGESPVAHVKGPGALATTPPAGCSAGERGEVLRAMQSEVLHAVPTELPSFASAVAPGGVLAGWELSHGYVVLATAGAVATHNLQAAAPVPPLLLYEPSAESAPADWDDFDGPDDPYRLAGWAYVAPYTSGSEPPALKCIAASEWAIHEAGWHLKDGGMHLTPGAITEPPRPPGLTIHMWHPRVWDLHVWRGGNGVPTVSFANPNERRGGKALPKEAFFRYVAAEPHRSSRPH